MKLLNLIKTQSGFSLVQGMIIAGVLAGSSLVATRIMQDQKKAMKGAESRDQIEQLHDAIYSTMQSKEHCTATFVTQGLQSGFNTAGNTFNLPEVRTSPGNTQFAVHTGTPNTVYVNGNVTIKSMVVTYTASPGVDSTANLAITYERLNDTDATKRTKSGFGAKEIKKTISLRVQRDPNAGLAFVGCYGLTNAKDGNSNEDGNDLSKQFCNDLNVGGNGLFVWDAAASMCKPKQNTCPAGQIYTGIDSNGVLKCRIITDWVNMNQVLDPTPPATCPTGYKVGFTVDTTVTPNKVRITCTP